ncbi:MAG: leucine-rich repeat domain-containing protein [Litoreibacter sp.]
MSDADQAYQAALEKIAQAKATGADRLSLIGAEFEALDSLPPELASLTNLQVLHFNGAQFIDLTPLQEIKTLQALLLNGVRVNDLTPLQALTNLQMLNLNGTLVNDLAPLQEMTNLRSLEFNGTQVNDLTPLQAMINLQLLSLRDTQVSDLAPLQEMIKLQELCLNGTRVNDLAPLRETTNLQFLSLNGTLVNDLRPIARLKPPKTNGSTKGIHCLDTPAIKRDALLAELAQITSNRERTVKILDYLRSLPPWPDPYMPETAPTESAPKQDGDVPIPPEQDPALPLIWGTQGFSFFADSIDSDPITQAALDDLRDLLDDLRRKGNQHDDLYRIAVELQDRSEGEISDLNMVKLHLSYQKLRRLHGGHASRQDAFDDETLTSIESVFDVLPGVTLADDNVRVLIERQEAERAAGLPPAQDSAAIKLLQSVQEPDAPFTPEVKGVAAEVVKPDIDDRLTGTRGIMSRNVVIGVFKFVGLAAAGGAIGGPVGTFMYNNGPDLLALAATMGDDAFIWAQSIMANFRAEYEIAMGITREVAGGGLQRPPRTPSQDESSNK